VSNARKDAWQNLVNAAARAVRDDFTREAQDELSQSAKGWAGQNGYRLFVGSDAPDWLPPKPSLGHQGGVIFPNYGRAKGQPIAGADLRDLQFYKQGCERTLADPSKARWHEKERELLGAIDAEISTR
jgi:hypothetical protein